MLVTDRNCQPLKMSQIDKVNDSYNDLLSDIAEFLQIGQNLQAIHVMKRMRLNLKTNQLDGVRNCLS